jgi:hypothetical protein
VQVYTEALPQAAAQWRALLDTPPAVSQPQIQLPVYPDPASAAVAAAMADWPAIHEARIAQRNAAAGALVGTTDNTSAAFTATDHSGADGISSSVGQTLL